jgi:branched-chain amino acid transport system substrate-binding protein
MNVAFGYDILLMFAHAIKEAGSDNPTAIRDAIENTKDLEVTHFKWTVDKDTHNPVNKPGIILKALKDRTVFFETWIPEL